MSKIKLHDWDTSKFLKDNEDIKYYLKAVFEDGTAEEIAEALGNVAKAVGAMNKISKTAKVNNDSLYRSLSKNGTPYFKTINKVINSLGYKLTIVPLEKKSTKRQAITAATSAHSGDRSRFSSGKSRTCYGMT